MCKTLRSAAVAAACLAGLASASDAVAGVIPTPAAGAARITHNAYAGQVVKTELFNMPAGKAVLRAGFNPSSYSEQAPAFGSIAKAGIGYTQSSNQVRVAFPSGVGVGQTDPTAAHPLSEMVLEWNETWIIQGGTFGPPITTAFSLPVGGKVGAGGSAAVDYDIHWDVSVGGTAFVPLRTPFTGTRVLPAGQTTLTNITAPAAASNFPVLADGSQIRLYGSLRFTVNNDDSPSLIEIPTAENFGALLTPEFNYEAGMSADEVPEPTALGACAVAAGLLACRRRRRVAR
jgi:hypothetical protein